MDVKIEVLRALTPSFEHVGDALDAALRRARLVIDAEGSCWGGDELGETFAQSYVPAVATVVAAFGGLSQGSRRVGQAIRLAADNAQASDDRARQRLG